MGNRAVIAFGESPNSVGIYLHWNGGRDSVEGFLAAAKKLGVRAGDTEYAAARLTQIIGNFFGGTLSVGVGVLSGLDCDNGDNGTYVIGKNLDIVKRKYFDGRTEQREHGLDGMVAAIIAAQGPIKFNSEG